MPRSHPAPDATDASASGVPSQGASTTLDPWTCFKRRSRPCPLERLGHAGLALLVRLGSIARGPLLEAVDEAGDGAERGNGRGAQSHRDMLAATPGLHYFR